MELLTTQPMAVNFALFFLAAAGVWFAGSRLALYADAISDRTGIGKAFIGLVFLATATELPEIATTFTAAIKGNAPLVLNNMFGGIALQTVILAVVDGLFVRGALTFYPRKPTHALEAALLIVLLTFLLAICIVGERSVAFNVGMGTLSLAAAYVAFIWILRLYDEQGDWLPVELPEDSDDSPDVVHNEQRDDISTNSLVAQSALASLAILICGVILVHSAEVIAVQSGLQSSFIGVTLLAAATSLPELSTTIAAARLGAFTMAISNIFGSNLIMVVLLLPADMLYRDGPILQATGKPEYLALVSGILVTAIYVVGLLVRRKPQIFGMGVDSAFVLAVYVLSLIAFYSIT